LYQELVVPFDRCGLVFASFAIRAIYNIWTRDKMIVEIRREEHKMTMMMMKKPMKIKWHERKHMNEMRQLMMMRHENIVEVKSIYHER